MLNFAYAIGMNGVVNVETFFLHSPAFKKHIVLKSYSQNNVVVQYTQLLKQFLTVKPVLAIAGLGKTCKSIQALRNYVMNQNWINYLSNIIGLSLANAIIIPVTNNQNGITSCLMIDGNKCLVLNQGGNNLPTITHIRQAKQKFCNSNGVVLPSPWNLL